MIKLLPIILAMLAGVASAANLYPIQINGKVMTDYAVPAGWTDPASKYWWDFEKTNTATSSALGSDLALSIPVTVSGSGVGWLTIGTNFFGGSEAGEVNSASGCFTSGTFSVTSGTDTNCTLSCWLKTTSTTGERGVLSLAQNTSTFPTNAVEILFEGTQVWAVLQRVNANYVARYSTATTTDGNWHFVACTFAGLATNNLNVYIDGAIRNNGGLSGGTVTGFGSTAKAITIGGRGTGSRFTGNIDGVKFYPSVLTSNQVYTAFVNGARPNGNKEIKQ